MPEASIVITATDRYSSAVKSMAATTKSFSKDTEQMEKTLTRLQKNKYELKVKTDEARAELKALEKQYAATGDEADRLKLEMAQAKYTTAQQNLSLVTKGAAAAQRQMEKTGEAFRKVGTASGGSSGMKGIISAVAAVGISQMAGQAAQQIGNTIIGSAFSSSAGSIVSSALSGGVSGAIMGASLMSTFGPAAAGVGALAGAGIGTLTGASQVFSTKDEAFKGYYSNLYDTAAGGVSSDLSSGSSIAAGRETDLVSFSTMFKSKDTAKKYLGDLVDMANTTPFFYDDLTSMSKTLATYGYGADSILPVLRTVGDTGAALGMNTSDMTMISTALGRMKSSDKTTLEYLNILNDRGVGAVGMLSDAYGVDQGTMYDMISKGKVSGTKAVEIILNALTESYSGAMEEQSKTFEGKTSTLEGLNQELQNAMGSSYNDARLGGIQEEIDAYGGALGDAMKDLNGIIGENKAYLENLGEQYKREALSAVLLGQDTTVYGDSDAEKLRGMAEEYAAAYAEHAATGNEESALKMEELKNQAESLATAAYESSDQYQMVVDAQVDSTEAIRENTVALDAATNAYRLAQERSKGMFSGGFGDDTKKVWTWGDGYGIPTDASKEAYGLDYVPRDNFPALLHQGERVLTASQARAADRSGGGVVIQFNEPVYIREDADIEKLADAVERRQARRAFLAVP